MCDCDCYWKGYEDAEGQARTPAIELERGQLDALAELASWLLDQDLYVQWDIMGHAERVDDLKWALRAMQRVVPAHGFNVKRQ